MYERAKRKQELKDIIDAFKDKINSSGYEFEILPDVEDRILNNYEILLNEGLRPIHVDGTSINIFKIASATEITVNYIGPIKTNSPKTTIFLNAQLALDIAFSLIFSKNFSDVKIVLTELEEDLLENHLEWLMYNNPAGFYEFSILGNASFWKSLFTCVLQRIENK